MSGKVGQNNSDKVIWKIFFVRHWDAENPGGIQSDKLLDIAKLSVIWQDQSRKIWEELYKLLYFSPTNKIRIIYDQNTERTRESLKYILEVFEKKWKKDFLTIEWTSNLPSMEKDFEGPDYIDNTNALHNARKDEVRNETTQLLNSLLEEVKNQEQIVLIGHKSNKESIVKNAIPDSNEKMNAKHNEIIDLNIVPSQIKGREWEKDYEICYYDSEIKELFLSNPDHLYITWQNLEGIKKSLNKEPFLTWFKQFSDKEISMIDLEKEINRYFRKQEKIHSEIYAQFFAFTEMRIFCLSNLIKLKKYAIISDLYWQYDYKLTHQEKKILLNNNNILEIKKLTIRHFISKNYLRDDEEWFLFQNNKLLDFYNQLQEKKKIYEKAIDIQSRSIDKDIKNQKEWSVLNRKVFKIEKQELWSGKMKYNESEINIQEIISWLKSWKKYVLPAHVGNGKSIWLSELVKKIILETDISYFEWKDFNKMDLNNVLELLHNLFGEGKIIFIDAMDEFRNPFLKELIKDTMGRWIGWVIITSRLSEYQDKENIKFETLNMKPINKNIFIESRIENEQKRISIQKKLEESWLASEIEWNPLLLNFVCKLINEEKYLKSIWIKSFEEICNTTDLYENIIKLILLQHEWEKSQYYIWESGQKRLENDMNLLSEFAYLSYKKNPIKSYGKDNLAWDQDQFDRFSILFKKMEDDYWFIHKSFEEFFLARYLANVENWDKEIYNVRDKIAGDNNRNEWKNFESVVKSYGEMLINKNRLDELKIFLWKNGILKNDDALWYNFNLWLDLLAEISKQWFDEEYINSIRKSYIDKINLLSENRLKMKLFSMSDFINIAKHDWLIDLIYLRIKNKNDEIYEIFSALITKNNINDILNYAKRLAETSRYYEAWWTYVLLALAWEKEWITGAIKCAKILFGREKYYDAWLIYLWLAQIWRSEWIAWVVKCANNLIDWESSKAWQLFFELAKLWTEEWIKHAIRWVVKFFQKSRYPNEMNNIYEILIKSWKYDWVEEALKWAKMLMEKWEYYWAWYIYEKLAKTWTKESIEASLKAAEIFIKNWEYSYRSWWIYEELIKAWTKEWIDWAIQWSKKLIKKWKYNEVWNVYRELANTWTEEWIKEASEYVKKLIKDGHYSIAWDIYLYLMKTWEDRWIEETYDFTHKLIEEWEYQKVNDIYRQLLWLWKDKWIKKAYEYVEKLIEKWEYYIAWYMYIRLARIWEEKWIEKWIEWAIQCSRVLMEKWKYGEAEDICWLLTGIWEKAWIEEAIQCSRILMEKWEYHNLRNLYSELIKTWKNECVKETIEWVKKLMEKWEYDEIWYICKELVKIWNKEWIELAHKSIEIFIEKWEYKTIFSIYGEMLSLWNKVEIKKVYDKLIYFYNKWHKNEVKSLLKGL